MNILINHQLAELKKGTSFEFIEENRFFTGADAYSLSITLPLKGCKRNRDIFSYINRIDCNLSDDIHFDCEIFDKDFHRCGTASIIEINDIEVKLQFLEGRSADNFSSSFDEIYINELDLRSLHRNISGLSKRYLADYDEQIRSSNYLGMVFLPWVNNTSGNIQNPMRLNGDETEWIYEGDDEHPLVVGQPFLLEVIKEVFRDICYTCDLSELYNSQWKDAIVCNALPAVWELDAMQYILPHWTVTEFIEQLELFFHGEFTFDHKNLTVSFRFYKNILNEMTYQLLDVCDEHCVEIAKPENAKNNYIEQRNIRYAKCDHQMWKFYDCEWIKDYCQTSNWRDIYAMQQILKNYTAVDAGTQNEYYKMIHYCRDEDTSFVLKYDRTFYSSQGTARRRYRYQPINVFGPRIVDSREGAECLEIKIVPACIDNTDSEHGDVIFVECGTMENGDSADLDDDDIETQIVNVIKAGEKEKKEEYFDKLYVAFWDGEYLRQGTRLPYPCIDSYEITIDSAKVTHTYNMRLAGNLANGMRIPKFNIDVTKKFTFSFLSNDIPNVRSVFVIRGKMYLAEKITATISENGLSQQMKMVAYRLI